MNAMTGYPLWRVLLASAMMFALNGCGVMITPTSTPTAPIVPKLPSSTTAPPYIHYTSPNAFNSHLEFDYPGYWYFSEGKSEYYPDDYFIFLADPIWLTIPTRSPDEPHGTPSDYGRIDIMIEPVKPGQTLESIVKEQKQSIISAASTTLLQDYPIEISGYDAYVLEVLIDETLLEGYFFTSVMFNRRIFFIAYDLVYTIDFTVAEHDRGGEFEKGYEYFFDSLRIVP